MMLPRLCILTLMAFVVAVKQPAIAADIGPCLPPEVIRNTATQPPYPSASQRAFGTGATMLMVSVAPDGIPTGATVTRSSGVTRLDEAASAFIVSHWRWEKSAETCPAYQQPITAVFELGNPPKADGAVLVPPANYPASAIQLEEQGVTYVTLTLKDGGAIENARIAYSTGYTDLDNQALTLVKASPNLTAGKPPGEFTIVFRWTLPPELTKSRIVVTSGAYFLCGNGTLATDKRRCN